MRGYQKRVVYLKNTGSRLFEEAYFVIKSDNRDKRKKEITDDEDFIEEVNRIIEENLEYSAFDERKNKNYNRVFYFGLGFLISSMIFIFYTIFI